MNGHEFGKRESGPAIHRRQSRTPVSASPDFEAADPALTADLALAAVKDRDLSSEAIEQISRNVAVMKSRKVRVALAAHPRAPRRIALRLIRELYTFDLMQFSLIPAVAADLKRVADELLVARLASITLGERIALARRSSAMVAAALLLDKESRVWQTALWRIPASLKRQSSKHCCAQPLRQLSSKRSAITPNGPCALRSAWRCCATNTLPWPAPSNSRAGSRPRNCATFCTLLACRKKSKPICGKILENKGQLRKGEQCRSLGQKAET